MTMTAQEQDKKCAFCDRVWGVVGIGIGVLITLIGFDLLSGGLVSKMVGSVTKPSDEVGSELSFEDIEDELIEDTDE
jgi:hypothetical protein